MGKIEGFDVGRPLGSVRWLLGVVFGEFVHGWCFRGRKILVDEQSVIGL